MRYRADIDGLRAIAVLSVVIFHLGVSQFVGGYIGVDVFFVISGYLITSLITARMEQGTFSLIDFYGRRIRRLFPPLMAMVIATFIAAAVILFPQDFIPFSGSAVAALFSLSNIVFYSEAGYWAAASELKPLLHTWSLGVEEQFYLLWPALLLFVLGHQRSHRLLPIALLLTITSFALCAWWTPRDTSAAFYLLPFRIFEFALGALIIPLSRAQFYRRISASWWSRDLLLVTGLTLIVWSVFNLDGSSLFPGWIVIVPTLGAALVLLAGAGEHGTGPLGRLLLANPLGRWLGKVSYSMYLVHWPLVSLYRYYTTDKHLEQNEILWLALATLVATVALHYLVESRFYQRAGAQNGQKILPLFNTSAPCILMLSTLLALLPLSAWLGNGWSWRQPGLLLDAETVKKGIDDRYQLIRQACTPRRWAKGSERCHKARPLQVLAFGDSHEPDAFNFLHATYGEDDDINLMHFGSTNGCPGLQEAGGRYHSHERHCNERFEALFQDDFIASLDILVYTGNRPFQKNRAIHLQVLRDLKARKPQLKIIIISGYIGTRMPCWMLTNRSGNSKTCGSSENNSYFSKHPQWQPLYKEFIALADEFIDRVSLLCTDRELETCLTETPEGVPMFYDQHHLSIEFAQYTGRLYEAAHPLYLKKIALEPPASTDKQ
ncbi:MAG: acyltransferase family protein [Parahaliea sp.]